MKRSNALELAGIVVGAVLGHAQTEPPKNLAGAEFPCIYTKPPAPYQLTAKFLETIGEATYATGIEIRSDTLIILPKTPCVTAMPNAN